MTLREKVVTLKKIENCIALVKMEDRNSKNGFSLELIEDLLEVFNTINYDEDYKVVVLTGYENYFATGGTKDTLLKIYENEVKFSDNNIYSVLINCKIPVISAMQGHAIGGGFIMGITGDIVILAKESVYTSNFMKYGFTPGMGATYILPYKIGASLSSEMLFTAENYRGVELQNRGIPFKVTERNNVLNEALKLAMTFKDKPRISLVTLKDRLLANLRNELPNVINAELKMHDITFHQEKVKENILNRFGN